MPLSRRHKITLIIVTVYWLALAAVMHIPVPQWARRTGFSDKTMHYFAYFILACLLWFAVSPDKKVNWRKLRLWLALLVIILYAILDEILQGHMGRSADIRDFAADVIGALAGFAILTFLSFPHVILLLGIVVMFALPSIARTGLIASAGAVDIGINFIAYGFLTVGWIVYKRTILNLNLDKIYFIITSLALPVAVLLCVKLFCVFRGITFDTSSIATAAAGILAASFIMFFGQAGVNRFK